MVKKSPYEPRETEYYKLYNLKIEFYYFNYTN
jgi:hypothetical protein